MAGEKIFVACPPGLEHITAREMRSLGFLPASAAAAGTRRGKSPAEADYSGGGVETIVSGSQNSRSDLENRLESVYRLNISLRAASRVLVRLGEFYAAAFSELRKKAGGLNGSATCLLVGR